MFLKKYDDLPDFMKNEEVKKYYDILCKKKISLFLKRIFDILVSLIILVILFPIMLILGICIKIDSKGPVFYRQERITTYGKVFRIFKFRTMVQDADKKGSLVTLQNDSRITKVGKFIRKFRLDEFPQLLNVITGDMTFVGTRPEVKKSVDRYTDEMKSTLLMPAGITSMASIKFKDEDEIIEKYVSKAKVKAEVTIGADKKNDSEIQENRNKTVDDAYIEEVLPQKMKYNIEYIEKFSVFTDVKICLDTVIGVLR